MPSGASGAAQSLVLPLHDPEPALNKGLLDG
jgi:hypothetical protein